MRKKSRLISATAFLLSYLGAAIIPFSDLQASEGQEKWFICHNGNTIEVATPAVLNAHLNHGDPMGVCGGGNDDEVTGAGDNPA